MVDVAAIVSVADRVAASESSRVVVVVYVGGDHTDTVHGFFKGIWYCIMNYFSET